MNDSSTATTSRIFPRVSAECSVDFEVVQDVGAPQPSGGVTTNVSGGGLCFTSANPLPPGTMVTLRMKMPQFPNTVMALAKVVWTKPLEGTSQHENGCEFCWLGWNNSEAHEAVLDYVNETIDEILD